MATARRVGAALGALLVAILVLQPPAPAAALRGGEALAEAARAEAPWAAEWKRLLKAAATHDFNRDIDYFGLYHKNGFRSASQIDLDIAEENESITGEAAAGGLLFSEKNTNRIEALKIMKKGLALQMEAAEVEMVVALTNLHTGPGSEEYLISGDLERSIESSMEPPTLAFYNTAADHCSGKADRCEVLLKRTLCAAWVISCVVGYKQQNATVKKLAIRAINESLLPELELDYGLVVQLPEVVFAKKEPAEITLRNIPDKAKLGGYLTSWTEFRTLVMRFTLNSATRNDNEKDTVPAGHADVDPSGAKRAAFQTALAETTKRIHADRNRLPRLANGVLVGTPCQRPAGALAAALLEVKTCENVGEKSWRRDSVHVSRYYTCVCEQECGRKVVPAAKRRHKCVPGPAPQGEASSGEDPAEAAARQISEDEAFYIAACTPEGEDKPVWNHCRDVLYLRKGFLTNSDMARLTNFRGGIVNTLLEMTGAEAHSKALVDALEYNINGRSGSGYEMANKLARQLFGPWASTGPVTALLTQLKTKKELFNAPDFTTGLTHPVEYRFAPFLNNMIGPAPRVTFPNLGSDTPTSDIDIPVTGLYSEFVVGAFYDKFRARYNTESSTAMDTNIYSTASDFVIRTQEKRLVSRNVGSPPWSPSDLRFFLSPQTELVQTYYENGDVASLLGIRRSMNNDAEWQVFTDKVTKRMAVDILHDPTTNCGGTTKRLALLGETFRRIGLAERKQAQYQHQLVTRMNVLKRLGTSETDVLNRAMNELYAEGVMALLPMRVVFEQFVDSELLPLESKENASPSEIAALVVRADLMYVHLVKSFTDAGYFGNEAYVGGGALLHVVGNMQGGRGLLMTPEDALQSVNENYGMLLHAFHHIHHDEPEGLRLGRALMQTGKYFRRIADAFRFLQNNTPPEQLGLDTPANQKLITVIGEMDKLGQSLERVKKEKVDNVDGQASVMITKSSRTLVILQQFLFSVWGLVGHVQDDSEELAGKDPETQATAIVLDLVSTVVAEINAIARLAAISMVILSDDTKRLYGTRRTAFKPLFDARVARAVSHEGDQDDEASFTVDHANLRRVLLKRVRAGCAADAACKEKYLGEVEQAGVRNWTEYATFLSAGKEIPYLTAPACLKEETGDYSLDMTRMRLETWSVMNKAKKLYPDLTPDQLAPCIAFEPEPWFEPWPLHDDTDPPQLDEAAQTPGGALLAGHDQNQNQNQKPKNRGSARRRYSEDDW